LDLDWEALRWRELEWGALPHTTRKGTIPYLTVREAGRLDCAMTNSEARPHLVKSYKGMESPGFNGHVYTGTHDKKRSAEHEALRWAMKRGINLRGLEIELEDPWYDSPVRGVGPVLLALMNKGDVWYDMKLAKYFAARCKSINLDDSSSVTLMTALTCAASEGHLDILKALIAAGADEDMADGYGHTPLNMAADNCHVECVKTLLAVKADVNHADRIGWTPLISASCFGSVEIVKLLLAAGAMKDKIDTRGKTVLTYATEGGHHEIVQLLQQAK
jgi:hypothetical protein